MSVSRLIIYMNEWEIGGEFLRSAGEKKTPGSLATVDMKPSLSPSYQPLLTHINLVEHIMS